MPPVRSVAGALIDAIKVNAISREMRDGHTFWRKRRRAGARFVLAGANAFFRLAQAPLRALDRPSAWQRWEVESFELLHGDRFRAFREGANAVVVEELPGLNLTIPLDQGTLTREMAKAAGCELRRAHDLSCTAFDGPWSHGDPHLGNFVYELEADRARLIDFEVRHERSVSAEERHADDVLAFLQDMLGRVAADGWTACAHAFLDGYGEPNIAERALRGLSPPRGVRWLWWSVRTSWLAQSEVVRRVSALHESLEHSRVA
jgi:hypothetical protein